MPRTLISTVLAAEADRFRALAADLALAGHAPNPPHRREGADHLIREHLLRAETFREAARLAARLDQEEASS